MICFIFTSIEMAMICCDNSIEVENTTSRQTASVECQVVSSRTLKCGAASCILSAHKSFQHLHYCHTLSSMYNKNQYRTASCTTDLATCTVHLTALHAASHGHRLSYVIVLVHCDQSSDEADSLRDVTLHEYLLVPAKRFL
jgi:hypothetical protein